MPFLEQAGFRMHYEVIPNLLPVHTLFIHGNLSSNAWWEPSLEALEGHRNKSAVPDRTRAYSGHAILAEWRGCGRSSGPQAKGDLEMSALARDYLGLLAHLGINRCCVVAHSTGGLIGLHAMRARPELFARAALLDPVPPGGLAFPAEALATFARMGQDRQVCEAVLAATIHGVQVADPYFQRLVEAAFRVDPAIWLGIPEALENPSFAASVAEVPQPVLVLHGALDPVLPVEGSRKLAESLPAGDFKLLEGQGHSCNVENPQLFTALISRFLYDRGLTHLESE